MTSHPKVRAALAILAAAAGLALPIRGQSPPQVTIATGRLSGSGGDIASFKGVPFARPPIGDLRWAPPVAPEPWTAVRAATAFSPACVQEGDPQSSEDCLTLNVWAPASALASAPQRASLPVMVWIFGGSFTSGSNQIDGAPMARRGVVVVSLNYRLSTFGFLAHPQLTTESPNHTSGNYGLLDAMAGLAWVQQNIAVFGGDPRRVTVWGWSAGGSLITAMLSTPRAQGLFQQAILQSAGALRHWKSLPQAESEGQALSADIRALRALPAKNVPFVQQMGGDRGVRALFEPRLIGPIRDGYYLAREERETFEAGDMPAIPLLVGSNTDEGGTYTAPYRVKTLDAYRDYLRLPRIFGSSADEGARLYPAANDREVTRAVSNGFGDSQFNFGARGVARAMAAKGVAVYRYRFARKSDAGRGHDPWHGDEVPYVFGLASRPAYGADDRALSEGMMDAWARFAKTGDPSGGVIGTWPRYDATDPAVILDVPISVERGYRNAQLDFVGRLQRAAGE